jgi:hypothetical protein
MKDYRYAARVYMTKAVQEKALETIKTLAYTLIRPDMQYEVTKAKDGELFEGYTYCHDSMKTYCPHGYFRYQGYLKPNGYSFYSNSEIGIWCKLVENILGNEMYFPCI